jgi:hypothetical protein
VNSHRSSARPVPIAASPSLVITTYRLLIPHQVKPKLLQRKRGTQSLYDFVSSVCYTAAFMLTLARQDELNPCLDRLACLVLSVILFGRAKLRLLSPLPFPRRPIKPIRRAPSEQRPHSVHWYLARPPTTVSTFLQIRRSESHESNR